VPTPWPRPGPSNRWSHTLVTLNRDVFIADHGERQHRRLDKHRSPPNHDELDLDDAPADEAA